ncbi:ComF family protein [Algoriphagus lutimaris]|uniref:ComF family protein n=1 Tax=Algoriphagus lutimaris TaxID=613197 RepID=UPI00196AE33B|nr:phosphoribosyltransferase family protein [Algoriphagus lutimaris]MBN3521231.1 ComF family protein [Algoriphagus lutimaris]
MRLLFIKDFFDLIFPRTCDLCGRNLFDFESCLCKICIGTLPKTLYHLMPSENDLIQKIKGIANVGMTMSFLRFTKNGQSQKILHCLKYRNKPKLGIQLGELYSYQLNEVDLTKNWDVIVPVPLHPIKKYRRGYNQSEEFAKGLSNGLKLPMEELLERKKFTETQTKKTRIQRMENVDEVFVLARPTDGRRILLVDDVITTGATLCSCANVLLANGAKTVDLITIAAGK